MSEKKEKKQKKGKKVVQRLPPSMRALDLRDQINAQFPGTVCGGNDKALDIVKLPSKVFTFDYQTGGGIPRGRITILRGPKSSGKTTHLCRLINSFLEENPDQIAVLADFEKTYLRSWGKQFIKDIDRLTVLRPDFGEQGIDIMQQYMMMQDVGFIGVDSLAMMFPTAEVEGSASDSFVGMQAKLVNKMWRKMVTGISQAKNVGRILTCVCVNQETAIIGGAGGFGPKKKMPGGYMQEFVASMIVDFWHLGYKKIGNVPVWGKTGFVVSKNKVGLPRMSGEFMSCLYPHGEHKAGEVDELDVIVEYAKRHGLIVKDGKVFIFDKKQFKSKEDVPAYLSVNPKVLEKLKQDVLKAGALDILAAGCGEGEVTDEAVEE